LRQARRSSVLRSPGRGSGASPSQRPETCAFVNCSCSIGGSSGPFIRVRTRPNPGPVAEEEPRTVDAPVQPGETLRGRRVAHRIVGVRRRRGSAARPERSALPRR
jgi:hypothetical protein